MYEYIKAQCDKYVYTSENIMMVVCKRETVILLTIVHIVFVILHIKGVALTTHIIMQKERC